MNTLPEAIETLRQLKSPLEAFRRAFFATNR
jgi:hypothetical protein